MSASNRLCPDRLTPPMSCGQSEAFFEIFDNFLKIVFFHFFLAEQRISLKTLRVIILSMFFLSFRDDCWYFFAWKSQKFPAARGVNMNVSEHAHINDLKWALFGDLPCNADKDFLSVVLTPHAMRTKTFFPLRWPPTECGQRLFVCCGDPPMQCGQRLFVSCGDRPCNADKDFRLYVQFLGENQKKFKMFLCQNRSGNTFFERFWRSYDLDLSDEPSYSKKR